MDHVFAILQIPLQFYNLNDYLDGLLKIPFSVYKREPILNIMNSIRTQFKNVHKKYNIERTEKYLKFAQEKLKCKIPFLVFNELDWIQFIKSKSKQQFINYLKKYLK